MTVGQRIKMRREALGLSQQELAEKVGYASRSSINKIELSRDLPLKKVEKMAIALDTTPSFLMGWTKNPSVDYNPRAMDNIYTDIPGDDTPEGQLASLSHDHSDIDKAILLYEEYQKAPDDVRSVIDRLLKSSQPET